MCKNEQCGIPVKNRRYQFGIRKNAVSEETKTGGMEALSDIRTQMTEAAKDLPTGWKLNTSAWQCCPLCNGTGVDMRGNGINTSAICTVCNGAKIISTLTGLPPGRILPIDGMSELEKWTKGEKHYVSEIPNTFWKVFYHWTIRENIPFLGFPNNSYVTQENADKFLEWVRLNEKAPTR